MWIYQLGFNLVFVFLVVLTSYILALVSIWLPGSCWNRGRKLVLIVNIAIRCCFFFYLLLHIMLFQCTKWIPNFGIHFPENGLLHHGRGLWINGSLKLCFVIKDYLNYTFFFLCWFFLNQEPSWMGLIWSRIVMPLSMEEVYESMSLRNLLIFVERFCLL